MKRMLIFAKRNLKEMVRDPMNMGFGIGFPLILILLLSLIQSNIPVEMFQIEHLAPGVAVFGLSFVSLFSGMLIARDRTESFLMRLFSAPMTAMDFILGYILPLIPLAVAQSAVCLITAMCLGMPPSLNMLAMLMTLLPAAMLFISIGMLCGSVMTDKQVGSVCGAILTNLSAWLSGVWFSLDLVGGALKAVANALPFVHAVNAARAAAAGNFAGIWVDIAWVCGYALALTALAVWAFRRQMRAGKA